MSDLFSGIANLTKTVTDTLNSYEIRTVRDKMQSYIMNFTDAEIKVREATSEEAWGPTPDMMREIAGLTFQYDSFPEVMGMLWKRMLPPSPVAWRHTYKSLILLEYLLKNGCERVISNARDHVFEMRSLEHYKCLDERGKDQGINVRQRVKIVLNMLEDDEVLRNERRKAKLAGKDEKYKGFSRDEMNMRGFSGSSFSNNSSSNSNSNKYNSKKSNFDNDTSSYDRDSRFDDEFSSSNREVTAFDFGGQRREASPELGFPADNHHNNIKDDDDDGFGDFTETRATSQASKPAPKINTTKNSFDDFGDFETSLPSPAKSNNRIPSVPPPPGNKLFSSPTKKAAPKQTQKQNHDDFDFFAVSTAATPASKIAPPSGPSSPVAANTGTTDIFGGDLFQTNSNFTNSSPAPMNNSLDLFAPVPSNNGSSSNSFFDIMGSSSQPSNISPAPMQSIPIQQSAMPPPQKSDDMFGSLDIFSKPSTNIPKTPEPPKNAGTPQNKSALWNDLSGSLDLDNLLSTKPKQSMSINEMKNKQGGMSGSNSFM